MLALICQSTAAVGIARPNAQGLDAVSINMSESSFRDENPNFSLTLKALNIWEVLNESAFTYSSKYGTEKSLLVS